MRRADDVLDQALVDVVTRNPALALRWYDKVGSTGTFPRPPRLISPRGGWQQDYFRRRRQYGADAGSQPGHCESGSSAAARPRSAAWLYSSAVGQP